MGNCFATCLGSDPIRKYTLTRYHEPVDTSADIEAACSQATDDLQNSSVNWHITEHERQLLEARNYDTLVHEQAIQDKRIEEKLAVDEEELRLEEEALIEAKLEAVRVAKLSSRTKEIINPAKLVLQLGSKTWSAVPLSPRDAARTTSGSNFNNLATSRKSDAPYHTQENFPGNHSTVQAKGFVSSLRHRGRKILNSVTNASKDTCENTYYANELAAPTSDAELELEWDDAYGIVPCSPTSLLAMRSDDELSTQLSSAETADVQEVTSHVTTPHVQQQDELDNQYLNFHAVDTDALISEIEQLTEDMQNDNITNTSTRALGTTMQSTALFR